MTLAQFVQRFLVPSNAFEHLDRAALAQSEAGDAERAPHTCFDLNRVGCMSRPLCVVPYSQHDRTLTQAVTLISPLRSHAPQTWRNTIYFCKYRHSSASSRCQSTLNAAALASRTLIAGLALPALSLACTSTRTTTFWCRWQASSTCACIHQTRHQNCMSIVRVVEPAPKGISVASVSRNPTSRASRSQRLRNTRSAFWDLATCCSYQNDIGIMCAH